MGYGLGVPERAGSLAMGAPREEPSGSVCSGSDTHNSMFFRGVLPQGGLARLRETVPCGYTVEKKVDLLNCLQGNYIYVATDHMTYTDVLLSQQESSNRVAARPYPDSYIHCWTSPRLVPDLLGSSSHTKGYHLYTLHTFI